MIYNYSKLKGLIVEKFGTLTKFSDAIGISLVNLSKMMNNKAGWTRKNIEKACELLSIADSQIGDYFFTKMV